MGWNDLKFIKILLLFEYQTFHPGLSYNLDNQKKTYLESLQVVNKNIWHPQIVDQIQIYWLKLIHIDRPRIQKDIYIYTVKGLKAYACKIN